jgi:hypothetical protein
VQSEPSNRRWRLSGDLFRTSVPRCISVCIVQTDRRPWRRLSGDFLTIKSRDLIGDFLIIKSRDLIDDFLTIKSRDLIGDFLTIKSRDLIGDFLTIKSRDLIGDLFKTSVPSCI